MNEFRARALKTFLPILCLQNMEIIDDISYHCETCETRNSCVLYNSRHGTRFVSSSASSRQDLCGDNTMLIELHETDESGQMVYHYFRKRFIQVNGFLS